MMGREHLAKGGKVGSSDHRDPLWGLIVRGLRWETGGLVLADGLLLAVVYAACGYLGWWLEDPGIRSFVIWPGAGVAVAMLLGSGRRIWFGIPLGILLLQFWMRHVDPAPQQIGIMMRIPWAAALAATVQAVLAKSLIRWSFGTRVRLASPRDAVILLMLAGPISCAVAAATGAAGLYMDGLVPVASLFDEGARIWLGSSLGVAVFLPLGLMTLAPEREGYGVLWKEVPLRRLLTPLASFVLLSCVFLSAFLANAIAQSNERSQDKMFALAATRNEAHLQHKFASLKEILDEAALKIALSPRQKFTRWQQFVHPALVYRLRGLEEIGMLRLKPGASASMSEQAASGPLEIGFAVPFRASGPSKSLRIEPSKEIGLAARASFETGNPVATGVLVETGSGKPENRIMLIEPVMNFLDQTVSRSLRHPAMTRWTFLLLDPDALLPVSGGDNDGAVLSRIALGSLIGPWQTKSETIEIASTVPAGQHRITTRLFDLGRTWDLTWDSTPQFEATASHRESRLVLFGSLMTTLLIAGLVQVLTDRQKKISREVERRTAELNHELRKNRSIVQNADVGIILMDPDGRVISANPAGEAILDVKAENLIGKDMAGISVTGSKDIAAVLEHEIIAGALATVRNGEPVARVQQISVISGRGYRCWIEARLTSFENEAGDPTITLILKDVTDTVAAQEQLEATEERWNLALEGSDIGVFDIDLVNRTAVVSDAWRRLVGFATSDDIDVLAEWRARVHPEDWPQVAAANEACFAGRAEGEFIEYRLKRKDGTWCWIRRAARVVEWDSDNRPLRLVGTIMDITPLRDALALAQSSEKSLSSLIETAPVAMAVIGLDGGFQIANDAFCKFTGYSKDYLAKTNIQDLPGAEYFRKNREKLRQLMRGNIKQFSDEQKVVRNDGTEVWGILTGTILWGRPGDPPRFIAQILDITETKKLEMMKGDFVATVSHELRTPLTSINGSLGLLLGLMSKDLPDKATHLLEVAHQNGERLLHLVNDLLDMQKLSSGNFDMNPADVEVGRLVTEASEEARSYAARFNVKLEAVLPCEMIRGCMDENRFKQVLANLLSNAAKFSHEGGTVRTEVTRDGNFITVSVTDRGRGIPEEFQSKIFRPFSQVASATVRDRDGTGLGLVISKEIVEQMGGKIGFESTPGAGSTFWFTLPIDNPDPRLKKDRAKDTSRSVPGPKDVGDVVIRAERKGARNARLFLRSGTERRQVR